MDGFNGLAAVQLTGLHPELMRRFIRSTTRDWRSTLSLYPILTLNACAGPN